MRYLFLSLVAATVHFAALSSSFPLGDLHVDIRSGYQVGDPTTSIKVRPPPTTLFPRALIRVPVPNTRTYIMLRTSSQIAGGLMRARVKDLLNTAYGHVEGLLARDGDGNIADGFFTWRGDRGVTLQVWNNNNHQTTYGVLGVVIHTLQWWMGSNEFMAVNFDIYDGANQVGSGEVT